MSTDAMSIKVVQVPMPMALLEAITRYAKEQKESRAALIRRALEGYLAEMRRREMDEACIKSYRRMPEDTRLAEASATWLAGVVPEEEW